MQPLIDRSTPGLTWWIALGSRSDIPDVVADRPRATFSADALAWAEDPARVCLYCGTPAPVGPEEHVLSRVLAHWWVLPPNVVCDRPCNHGVGSVLDESLLDHPFIQGVRFASKLPGSKGQPPEIRVANMKAVRDPQTGMSIQAQSDRDVRVDDEGVELLITSTSYTPKHKIVWARALHKVALGILWLGAGPDETSHARYDAVRRVVCGEGGLALQLGFGNAQVSNNGIVVSVMAPEGASGMYVSLTYLGVEIWAASGDCVDRDDRMAEVMS